MGRGAKGLTGQMNLIFIDAEPSRYFFHITGAVSAHHCITPRSRHSVHDSDARKKPLKKPFVMETVKVLPAFISMRHGYVQPAGSEWH